MRDEDERKALAAKTALDKNATEMTNLFKAKIANEIQHAKALSDIEKDEGVALLTKRKNEARPSWDKAMKTAYDLYSSPHAGHDTFASTYSKLVALDGEMVGAIYMQLPVLFTQISNNWAASFGASHQGAPKLYINVNVDDNSVLNMALSRNDDKAVDPELLETFQALVVAWLETEGYEPAPDGSGVYLKDGEPLTSEALKSLKPEIGLPHCLAELQVEFSPRISPSM